MSKTVVITGAAGKIGQKLRKHFEGLGWQLHLIDITNAGDATIMESDLSVWDESWVTQFADVDAVILLAGTPSPKSTWASIQELNLDLVLNVYEAAASQRAKRVVFASSNWIMAGYRFDRATLPTDRDPLPVNAYGASKLFGERIGRSFSERWDLSSINLRIGYNQSGQKKPGNHMDWGTWGQEMWLSDRDLCDGFEKAVLAPMNVRFAVLNLMSDNLGMRWDIKQTKQIIGYQPRDAHEIQVGTEEAARDELVARAREMIEVTEAWLADFRC